MWDNDLMGLIYNYSLNHVACLAAEEATNTNFKSTNYHTRGTHANRNTTVPMRYERYKMAQATNTTEMYS